jgi:predicted dehydrogenase
MKRIKVGILGAGGFARAFTPLFKAHPQVRAVSMAEIIPERRKAEASLAGVGETHGSLDELLASDCDAVAIFTQRWLHAPQAIAALNAGKHVYSAVPAGANVEEIGALVEAVRRTGLTYMLGETSYYYPSAIFCREMWRRGKFGRFV